MLYHVSTDIALEEKKFVPRVPKFRLAGEDVSVKRICVSNSIRNCISSFPYKNVIMRKCRTQPTFLSLFAIQEQSFKKEEIKKPEDIKEKVSDAVKKQEYWILKEFSATPSLIRIKRLDFSGFCEYTNDYSGDVTELEYEKEIEDKDRVEKAMFYHKRFYKEFLKACLLNGIQIQEDNTSKENMEYFGCLSSTREYTVHRLTYKIPAGVSAKPIWNSIQKELNKNRRKCLVYQCEDFS